MVAAPPPRSKILALLLLVEHAVLALTRYIKSSAAFSASSTDAGAVRKALPRC